MTEKGLWKHCLQKVQESKSGHVFLCNQVMQANVSAATKKAMLTKIHKAMDAMGRKPVFGQTRVMTSATCFEYAKLIRSAFCRRMIHECE